MGQVIPRQHPEVVLRSHFNAVRALLCVALVAIVALATTVVIVATDDNDAAPVSAQPKAQEQQIIPPGTRFDGGPDEGTRGPQSYWESSEPRSSYQPAPADSFKDRAGGPSTLERSPGTRP